MWVLDFNGHNQLPLTQDKKITLQEYASRLGLGFLTFPENCTCSEVGDTNDNDDGIDSTSDNGIDSTSDDKEICSDPNESDDQVDIRDPSLPKSSCCRVKLGPWF